MPVIAEYRCVGCGAVRECWTPSPPPPTGACAACGGPSRRLYGFSAAGRAAPPPAAAATSAASACRGNPDVPLLCHVDPAAAPGWIARYRRDNQALEAHIARTEENPPAPAGGGGHHHHGHSHGPPLRQG